MALVTLAGAPTPFRILYNPGAELNGSMQGWVASMGFSVPLANFLPFITYIAGRSYSTTSTAGTFTRIIPMVHPDYPTLLCQDVEAKGTGVLDANGHFAWYKIKATFKMVPYEVDGSAPYQTIETTYGSKTYSLANTSYKFSDGTPSTQSCFVAVPLISYVVTLYQCTQLDDQLLGTLINAPINSTPFFGWPTKTVFLTGMDASLQMSSVGTPAYTRVVRFDYRSEEWNKFIRTDGEWDEMTDVAGNPVYATSDLNQILQ